MVNNPYYQPTWQAQQSRLIDQAQQQIKGRPVSSIDEVRATSVDFDGSIFYFPDVANKKIYTKQINYDGTSTINMYELKPIPAEIPNSQYVTREEFETIVKKIEERLNGHAEAAVQSAATQAQTPNQPAPPQFQF